MYKIGIDIGSTTVKLVVTKGEAICFSQYERHMSQVRKKSLELLENAREIIGQAKFVVALSGSGGLGLAKEAQLPFIQEVFATREVVSHTAPDTDVVIELGGEDAKIIFLTGGIEERMNGSCAGGTGAFIDQMAKLLDVDGEELDALALESKRVYPIASRCGVFAKSDIQPLLNQGASKSDVAASIFKAVVDQTIAGLAQGRRIQGKVMFLGGPLFFYQALQQEFVRTLGLLPQNALFPEQGRYAVALGAAMYAASAKERFTYEELRRRILSVEKRGTPNGSSIQPLFADREEYQAFRERHSQADVDKADLDAYRGRAYLGIDCGSTTTKLVLLDDQRRLLYSYYSPNKGNPVDAVRQHLMYLYERIDGRITLGGVAVTGYGEDLIKNAFRTDFGLVETVAHALAAGHFQPEVDFILDIGGQDMKCFRVKNGIIDSILLNEACSAGCGSFISTFAQSMGYEVEEFATLGLFGQYPVDLGSRCTVFMNSSVKQAQREGASVEDISAGISISVVKNAIYKVIRVNSPDALGRHVVVQGGTFLNDAVLRGFEREIGREVVRPRIAGLMGAFGAALYAMNHSADNDVSSLLCREELADFLHESSYTRCGLCENRCHLTINRFDNGRRFLSGNRCERPLSGGRGKQNCLPNLYRYKQSVLTSLPEGRGWRGKVGLPLVLNLYENLPFWHTFFASLGFTPVSSGLSNRALYTKGQFSIPSDTVCYPAKLAHGHIEKLLEEDVRFIFYPCQTYNFQEPETDNHYHCPVVAYYPELLHANVPDLSEAHITYLYPHLWLNEEKTVYRSLYKILHEHFPDIKAQEVRRAVEAAYEALRGYKKALVQEGKRAVEWAREQGKTIVVLAGRPYHADPEINHGIDALLTSLDCVVLTEDAAAPLTEPVSVPLLNQWTYHARLYNAAKYVTENPDMELVQLVSFGCGIDAITSDQVREILEDAGKLYTQIKIDEISNLGAARIRIRSLLAAREEETVRAAKQPSGVYA